MAIFGVVVARLIVLHLTALDLFYDEAQYWFWSQDLALGYFSKPPLIAWLIAGTTAICGDGEPCVRIAAPLFHGGTTLLVFGLGKALYNARIAFFAALSYLLAIGVSASSLLVSTDVPLLACWVIALWTFALYRQNPSWKLALIMGAAVAIGINAKYAMVYFPLCALAYVVFTADQRALLKRKCFWGGIATGLLGFVPNLIWNAQNAFITFSHTGENISGDGLTLDPLSFLAFFGSQFFVAGPILFAVFFFALARGWRSNTPNSDRLALWFSLPILTILGLQAFQSSANYNWAATAFPGLILFTVAVLVDRGQEVWARRHLMVGAVFAVFIGAVALAAPLINPNNRFIAQTNLEDMFGWQEHADQVAMILDQIEPDIIVTQGRRYGAGFAYYLRHREEPMAALRYPHHPIRNHFEFIQPWNAPAPGQRAAIITWVPEAPFAQAQLFGVAEAEAGTRPFRGNSYIFVMEGE